jgi:hypothetical protein
MGEYHTIRTAEGGYDQLCKLGTMDDWRYVRRTEVEALTGVDAGRSTNLPHALKDPSILYRFPWPDEDAYAGDLAHINQRDMFRTFTLPVPQEWLAGLEHTARWVSMGAANGGGTYNVNIAVPCPLSAAFTSQGLKNSGATPILQIVGERTDRQGHTRTIFGCGYCERLYAFPATPELARVQAILRTWRPHNAWYAQVADRLKARS